MKTCEKHPGAEPLPGYRLLKLLGRGGFGEVWKCEAPGRLHKAIKFVAAGEQFRAELAAFEHVRTIRHPYLLTLERVEVVAGDLVTVMELADGQVNDRFRSCVADGLRGIPREELLGYLKEAAEALDFLSNRYGLQHLDVKPENLLLLAGHIKVGDYGLVRSTDPAHVADKTQHGFTPRYAAPEVLDGGLGNRADQYSLALVYVELLTGKFPFSGKTAQQLLIQHLAAAPDLSALADPEREIVRRALSKDPTARYTSCSAFVRTLTEVKNVCQQAEASDQHKTTVQSAAITFEPGRAPRSADDTIAAGAPAPRPFPQLDHRRDARRNINQRKQTPPPEKSRILKPVVLTDHLHGMPMDKVTRLGFDLPEFVEIVTEAAQRFAPAPTIEVPPDAVARRFLCTTPVALIPFKLQVVANQWNLKIDADPRRVTLRHEAVPKLPTTGKLDPRVLAQLPKSGYELAVYLPAPQSADLTIVGSMFGAPEDDLFEKAIADIPAIMDQIRAELKNVAERRAHPRYAADFPVFAYPHYSDGEVGAPIAGRCHDISRGGVRFVALAPIRTRHIYLEFKNLDEVAGYAVLVQVIRSTPEPGGKEFVTVGTFGTKS